MKLIKVAVLVVAISAISLVADAANLEKGKVLFGDPKLGGGSIGVSCNSCHLNGNGLGRYPGQKSIRAIVNLCIKNDMNGVGIDPEGEDMANLVSYIDSLQIDGPIPERIAGFECLEE